ncbi:iron-containing alcohol dehydrogenase family protein [Streptomyces sp. NPDC003697]
MMTEACLLAVEARDYLTPRQVIVGDGGAARLGDGLLRWGARQGAVAVISDRVVAEQGIAETTLQGLRAAGFDPRVFAEVEGEPTLATAEAALEFVRAVRATAVVGIGGGSAMDVAKIAALAAGSGGQVVDYLGVDADASAPLPLALVPTTTGTGAEVTRISMLSDRGKKVISSHRLLVPTIAVLDVDLVVGLPSAVTASTGMDAFAHAAEAFLSTNRSSLSVDASLRAIALLREHLPRAVRDGEDRTARRATLYGAHLAGNALNAGVVLGHSLAYTIANRKPLPHGVTCAIALPYCLAYNAQAPVPALDRLARAITGGRSDRLTDAAEYVAELTTSLGMPSTLRQVGIGEDQVAEMATECMERYPRPTNPRPFERDGLTALVAAMHGGDLPNACAHTRGTPEEINA